MRIKLQRTAPNNNIPLRIITCLAFFYWRSLQYAIILELSPYDTRLFFSACGLLLVQWRHPWRRLFNGFNCLRNVDTAMPRGRYRVLDWLYCCIRLLDTQIVVGLLGNRFWEMVAWVVLALDFFKAFLDAMVRLLVVLVFLGVEFVAQLLLQRRVWVVGCVGSDHFSFRLIIVVSIARKVLSKLFVLRRVWSYRWVVSNVYLFFFRIIL